MSSATGALGIPLTRRFPIPTQNRTYVVESGTDTATLSKRQEAVKTARELSRTTWRPVRVRRDDAKMEMVFRSGSLQTYVYSAKR